MGVIGRWVYGFHSNTKLGCGQAMYPAGSFSTPFLLKGGCFLFFVCLTQRRAQEGKCNIISYTLQGEGQSLVLRGSGERKKGT